MNNDLSSIIKKAINTDDLSSLNNIHLQLLTLNIQDAQNILMQLKPKYNLDGDETDYFSSFAKSIKNENTLFQLKQDIYRRIICFSTRTDFFNQALSKTEVFSTLK